jgi:hypothetical protein
MWDNNHLKSSSKVDQMHLQHLQPPVLPLPTHSSRK